MDLGIAGRWALVCGSSQGLGRACAEALAGEGVNVVLNGRNPATLEAAAAEIRSLAAGASVVAAPGDLTTEAGRGALMAACGEPDILVTNSAGPLPGNISTTTEEDLATALAAHFFAPILLVQAVLPGMRARQFGRVVNITSAMVTTPRPGMVASAGARAGLTAVMKAVALDVASDNVTVNNLLPERIDSPRQLQMAQLDMDQLGIDFVEARRRQTASIAAGRLGLPAEFGASCAFLCSAQASFISGINLHLDGGSYPALV